MEVPPDRVMVERSTRRLHGRLLPPASLDTPESIRRDVGTRSNVKGVNVRSGFLLSCCGCVGGLVLASVVVWPWVLVFVSRRCGVLLLLWLGRFRPRWFFLGGAYCGRAPSQEPRAVGYFRCLSTPSRCMVWWSRHGRLDGIGGDMFVCGILYSPSGCLFDSCVFQSLPPRRYLLEVPVWDLRHVEKYSMPQGSCSELSAVTDFQDSLSI